MKRFYLSFFLAFVLLLTLTVIYGCKGKNGDNGTDGDGAGAGDFATFETAMADFKETVRFVSVSPDKSMAYDAAKSAEESWGEVKDNFPEDPPKKFRADTLWPDRVSEMRALMGDIKSAVGKEDFETAEAKVREAELSLLELYEANKIASAGVEAIKILDFADQLEAAFEEERFNDAKHIFPNMVTAQKNFFTAPIPDNARDRQDEYNESKDQVYDQIENFVEAEGPEARLEEIKKLKTITSEFWVEFG
ncbi:MAG: hypothetical protein GY771_16910 [bacterium]|nr:hypothetical protein [bacterium]